MLVDVTFAFEVFSALHRCLLPKYQIRPVSLVPFQKRNFSLSFVYLQVREYVAIIRVPGIGGKTHERGSESLKVQALGPGGLSDSHQESLSAAMPEMNISAHEADQWDLWIPSPAHSLFVMRRLANFETAVA